MAIQTGSMQFLPGPMANKASMSATPLKVKASALLWVPQREICLVCLPRNRGVLCVPVGAAHLVSGPNLSRCWISLHLSFKDCEFW